MVEGRRLTSLLGLTFFGLTPNEAAAYRSNLFRSIHEICFHSKGGYDWHTVYNMPIWLRRLTFNYINDYFEKKNEANEAQQPADNNRPKGPNISPDYSTTASN